MSPQKTLGRITFYLQNLVVSLNFRIFAVKEKDYII